MGASYLTGAEFKDSGNKEQQLKRALESLTGKAYRFVMKNDEITVLIDCTVVIENIVKRENRIETGHLTLDDIYFDLVNDSGVKIYFPLVQFQKIEHYGNNILFRFDSYWWMIRPE
jgi:hypothetical protein